MFWRKRSDSWYGLSVSPELKWPVFLQHEVWEEEVEEALLAVLLRGEQQDANKQLWCALGQRHSHEKTGK
jgi:hypothetical protein